MKYFLLFAIQMYWKIFPVKGRGSCLFKESCSRYVYHITNNDGFLKGVFALIERIRQCRPGYTLSQDEKTNTFELRLKNGKIIDQENIAITLLPPFNNFFSQKNI